MTTPWWTIRDPEARAAAKAQYETECEWHRVGVLDYGIVEYKRSDGTGAYRGGSGVFHPFNNELSRRLAFTLAQTPFDHLPSGIEVELPKHSYEWLTLRRGRRTATMLYGHGFSLRGALRELSTHKKPTNEDPRSQCTTEN